jgi:hypothetical protein
MLTKFRIPSRALLLALVAVCASTVPASNQAPTVRYYNLYEDNQGGAWCGGGCTGGWCCRITPVYVIQSDLNGEIEGL